MNRSTEQYKQTKVLSSVTEPKVLGSTSELNSWAVEWTEVLNSITEPPVKHFQYKEEISNEME
jgi:hypothetical protein